MARYLFEFCIDYGYKFIPLGVTGAVLSLLLAFINDMGYLALIIIKEDDSYIGRLAQKISKCLWGAIAPFTCIGLIGLMCYICKVLILLEVM